MFNLESNNQNFDCLEKQSFFKKIANTIFFPFANKKNSKKTKKSEVSSNKTKQSKITKTDSNHNKRKDRQDKRKKWKMPTPLVIVFLLLIITIIITWFPHTNWYEANGIATDAPSSDIDAITGLPGFVPPVTGSFGILDFSYAMFYGMMQALPIIFYLFILGAFIEIVLSTNAMDAGIESLLKKTKGKEIVIVPVLFTFFSLFGALFGMQEETLGYFAIIVPFMIMAGFGSMTAVGVMMLGTTTGIAASITNPFTNQIAIETINSSLPSSVTFTMELGDTLLWSFGLWLTFTAIGATLVTLYAKGKKKAKLENNQTQYDLEAEEWARQNYLNENNYKLDWRRITTLCIFGTAFLTMVFGVLPWSTIIPGYEGGAMTGEGGWWWLSSTFAGFGNWGFIEFGLLFMIAMLIVLFIYKKSVSESTKLILAGAKGMVNVSLVIAIARSISIVLTYSGLSFDIVNGVAGPAANIGEFGFMFVMFILFLFVGTIIPSTSGSATLLFPIVTPIVVAAFPADPLPMLIMMVLLFSIALGIANMYSPIQAVVMGSMELSGVKYEKALKPILVYAGVFVLLVFVLIIPISTVFV